MKIVFKTDIEQKLRNVMLEAEFPDESTRTDRELILMLCDAVKDLSSLLFNAKGNAGTSPYDLSVNRTSKGKQ